MVSEIGAALGDTKEQSIDRGTFSLIARRYEDAWPASSIDQWPSTAVNFGKRKMAVGF
jgi:hypothetical protein